MASAIIVRCHIKDSPYDRRLSLVRMIPDTQSARDLLALLQAHHINSGFFQRAKRAIEALLVNKIGNPSSRGNLVMTSPYDRPSSAQTLGEGEGCLNATAISGAMTLNYNAFHIPFEGYETRYN